MQGMSMMVLNRGYSSKDSVPSKEWSQIIVKPHIVNWKHKYKVRKFLWSVWKGDDNEDESSRR
jgi:hypothetical protein